MPSTPSSTSTNAPKLVRLRTLPVTFVPAGYFLATSDHGFDSSWRVPREIFCSSRLISNTIASISSPTLSTSEARAIRFVHDNSLTCTMPSMPSSNCTNAPYGTTLTILPRTLLLIGYFSAISSHGFRCFCLSPSETRSFSRSISKIITSTFAPTFTISLG